eukprot:EG_transcript_5703
MAFRPTAEERAAQRDARWADAVIDGRVHWSVREAYKLHAGALAAAVRQYYCTQALVTGLLQPQLPIARLPAVVLELIVGYAYRGLRTLVRPLLERPPRPVARPGASFRVTLRKRPMLSYEVEVGETDSVCIQPGPRLVVCHDGKLDRSGRRLSMAHRAYALDWVWGEQADNAEVYREVAPLVRWVTSGHDATLICYGQTGTGKTHTMSGALERIAADLEGHQIQIAFFEIHGKQCRDLLRGRAAVHLRSDAAEQVHVRGANVADLPRATAAEVMGVLRAALQLRSVELTERNPISSRSHAVCDMHVLTRDGRRGRLRCVDLAGSERNYETVQMTPQQHRESADINSSLMALKNCFRAHAAMQEARTAPETPAQPPGDVPAVDARVPYRASLLTRVLRDCFTDPKHRTVIIATVSPAATDLQHTVNTVGHVALMAPDLAALSFAVACDVPLLSAALEVPVWKWTSEQVVAWVASAEGGRFARLALPAGLDGRGLLGLSAQRLGELFEGTLRRARAEREGEAWAIGVDVEEEAEATGTTRLGEALFLALRRENHRILRRLREGQPLPALSF